MKCRKRYAASSLEELYGGNPRLAYVREIFCEGSNTDQTGNLVKSTKVPQYIGYTHCHGRTAQGGSFSKQAGPVIKPDLQAMVRQGDDVAVGCTNTTIEIITLLVARRRDLFTVAFQTGVRDHDITNMLGGKVTRLPGNRGVLLDSIFTKAK